MDLRAVRRSSAWHVHDRSKQFLCNRLPLFLGLVLPAFQWELHYYTCRSRLAGPARCDVVIFASAVAADGAHVSVLPKNDTGSGGALGSAWNAGTPRLLAWQAWHLETSTFISRGMRGTWWHRLGMYLSCITCTFAYTVTCLCWMRLSYLRHL